MESGDCEVVGRYDSQTKIRGFRIEVNLHAIIGHESKLNSIS